MSVSILYDMVLPAIGLDNYQIWNSAYFFLIIWIVFVKDMYFGYDATWILQGN